MNKNTTSPKEAIAAKQQASGRRSAATCSALEKLESAIRTAQNELEEAGYAVSTEELGKLYAAFSDGDDGEDGLYISAICGDVDLEGGWSVSFDDLAKELAENVDDAESASKLAAGLRRTADAVERIHSLPNAGHLARKPAHQDSDT
jgi:hypothetical protein